MGVALCIHAYIIVICFHTFMIFLNYFLFKCIVPLLSSIIEYSIFIVMRFIQEPLVRMIGATPSHVLTFSKLIDRLINIKRGSPNLFLESFISFFTF